MDGLRYGRYFFQQFPVFLQLLSPIFPLFKLYTGVPFASLVVFFAIYGGIINNMRFSRFVRYNAMQAVLLSIIQILASVVLQLFPKGTLGSGIGLQVYVSLNNTVWFYILGCVVYAVGSALIGEMARLPLLASAADQRVP
ncbi:hypothetical protein WJX73_005677 [Symbiochloris irregularis]|uniref:Protein TIC 20 n=1 Tax=Symbiochloris irregularis TaxID=706552 RepID=A0AAW1PG54_9CHLO